MSTSRKHDWLVDKLYEHPDIMGISPRDVLTKTKEHALLYKGQLLTIPDLVIDTTQKQYMFEIKSNASQWCYDKGMSQLEKIALWHREYSRPEPETWMIMPKEDKYSVWIDMLDELNIYKLGDSLDAPSGYIR